jgi:hypothetical protein
MTPGKAFWMGALSKTLATVVTYPYIMAKVRLQAKYDSNPQNADEDAQSSEKSTTSSPSKKRPTKERYSGAIDVLRQVYSEKGCVGWYQVCTSLFEKKKKNAGIEFPHGFFLFAVKHSLSIGHASSDYEGCSIASSAVRNQRHSRRLHRAAAHLGLEPPKIAVV